MNVETGSAQLLDRKSQGPIALSVPRNWPRERDPIENFADKEVSLSSGEVFSYDLIVQPQTK